VSTRSRRKFTWSSRPRPWSWSRPLGATSPGSPSELGIYDSTLANWVRQAREQAKGAPTAEERTEIRELRRELERPRRERDILAKAVAFFSGPPRI
jgi:hypothetical protein